eukprot:5695945-Pyramimonas_sp.AAC.1
MPRTTRHDNIRVFLPSSDTPAPPDEAGMKQHMRDYNKIAYDDPDRTYECFENVFSPTLIDAT